MTTTIKTTFETLEAGVWCIIPSLIIWREARGLSVFMTWLRWGGTLAIKVQLAKKC